MALSPWSSSDLYRGPAALSPGAIRRKTGQDGLPHGVSLTVFRSLGELNGENRGKNPENTGENELEPVVGIGRFCSMNDAKIADLLRKSTSLGKSLLPSTTRFS